MPKFTLKADHPVTLFSPRGNGSMIVEPKNEIDVPGDLVTERPKGSDRPPLPDDAYIVTNHGEEKAWPHSMWELVGPKTKTETVAKSVKEN